MTSNIIRVYTDGACSGNPGPGGWAAIVLFGEKEVILKGGESSTTNNRMELKALINALQYVQENFPSLNRELEIYSDSKYVIDGVTTWMPNWKKRGWKSASKEPVKNRELWEEIDHLQQGIKLNFIWVKGHNEDKYNEMADEIAVQESKR